MSSLLIFPDSLYLAFYVYLFIGPSDAERSEGFWRPLVDLLEEVNRPACLQQPNGYIEPTWLRYLSKYIFYYVYPRRCISSSRAFLLKPSLLAVVSSSCLLFSSSSLRLHIFSSFLRFCCFVFLLLVIAVSPYALLFLHRLFLFNYHIASYSSGVFVVSSFLSMFVASCIHCRMSCSSRPLVFSYLHRLVTSSLWRINFLLSSSLLLSVPILFFSHSLFFFRSDRRLLICFLLVYSQSPMFS